MQTLQTEAAALSAQVTSLQVHNRGCMFLSQLRPIHCYILVTEFVLPLQKDYSIFINQNSELKLRIQAMEQQAHLRDGIDQTRKSTSVFLMQ